jgi:biofilm PGA synthesis lipoprotein PgaB
MQATRRALLALPAALLSAEALARALPPGGDFAVLCYHEIGPDGRDPHSSISETRLVQHFAWLRESGRVPVRLDDLIAAREGRRPLPRGAVLITFDDGYAEFHSRAMPALRAFGYPAIVALVTSWMETPRGGSFDYGGRPHPREKLMSWAAAREMQATGLVEFACHSHDLHHGVPGNPVGHLQPAAVTRRYEAGHYEDDAAWTRRITRDLARSVAILRRELGRAPRAMVWPYGRYNHAALEIAARAGLPFTFTLDPEPARLDRLDRVARLLLMEDPGVPALERALRFATPRRDRVIHVALDSVHDPDPAVLDRNLDALVERMAGLAPGFVCLSAMAADGAAYFPTRHAPLRADLFNRVSWALSTRAGAQVLARLPLADPRAVALAEDLARHAPFAGLVLEPAPPGAPAAAVHRAALRWRAPLLAARMLDAADIAALPSLLETQDRVALMLPRLPAVTAGEALLRRLVDAVAAIPGGIAGTVFTLDAAGVPAAALRAQLRALQRAGAHHLGFGPDDPLRGAPAVEVVADAITARAFPWRR